MKIKEQCAIWLPQDADSDDLVLGATHLKGARAHIMLNIRKKDGREDNALLILPADILDKALVMINATEGLTLREVGELDIPLV